VKRLRRGLDRDAGGLGAGGLAWPACSGGSTIPDRCQQQRRRRRPPAATSSAAPAQWRIAHRPGRRGWPGYLAEPSTPLASGTANADLPQRDSFGEMFPPEPPTARSWPPSAKSIDGVPPTASPSPSACATASSSPTEPRWTRRAVVNELQAATSTGQRLPVHRPPSVPSRTVAASGDNVVVTLTAPMARPFSAGGHRQRAETGSRRPPR